MAKRTFKSVFMGGFFNSSCVRGLDVVMEHQMSVFRPAWTSNNQSAAGDLHGVRTSDGTAMTKNYFNKSKGLWYGWK